MKTYVIILLVNVVAINISSGQGKKSFDTKLGSKDLDDKTSYHLVRENPLFFKNNYLEDELTSKVLTQAENCHMTAITYNELSAGTKGNVLRTQLENQISDEDQKKILNKIEADNKHLMDKRKTGSAIIKLNGEIIKSSVNSVPIFGKLASYGVDKLTNYLIDESLSSVKTDLKSRLDSYKKNQPQVYSLFGTSCFLQHQRYIQGLQLKKWVVL